MSTWSTTESIERLTRLKHTATNLSKKVSGRLTVSLVLDPHLNPYKNEHLDAIKELIMIIVEAEEITNEDTKIEKGECEWRIEPLISSWAWTRDWKKNAPLKGVSYKYPGPWYMMVDKEIEAKSHVVPYKR